MKVDTEVRTVYVIELNDDEAKLIGTALDKLTVRPGEEGAGLAIHPAEWDILRRLALRLPGRVR